MGKIIKSSFKKIIAKLFQILGISSLLVSFGACNHRIIKEEVIEGPVMYGVPGNFFTLEGTITDEDGNAIKGISLSAKAKADIPGNEEADGEQKNLMFIPEKNSQVKTVLSLSSGMIMMKRILILLFT